MFFKKKKANKSSTLKNSLSLSNKDKRLLHYKKRRELNRQKIILNKTKVLLKLVFIIGLFYLLYLLITSPLWILPPNIFSSGSNLVVKGATITKPERIIKELENMNIPQKPIYLINVKPYEEKIQKLSPIRKAFIRRYWLPARLEVLVEERTPMLTIAPNQKSPSIAAITSDRTIIPKEYLPIDQTKFPTYKILTYEDYTKWSDDEIKYLNTLAQRLEDYSGERLIYIDIRSKNNTYARLETVKVRIGELNSTLKERIMRLNSIMPQIENLKNKIEYIDLRWDDSTYIKQRIPGSPPDDDLIEEPEATDVEAPTSTEQTVKKDSETTVQKQPTSTQKTKEVSTPAKTEAKPEPVIIKKTETKPISIKTQPVQTKPKKTVTAKTTANKVSKPAPPKAVPSAKKQTVQKPVKLDAPPTPTILIPQ